MVLFTKQQTK
jgi:cyclin-dependent kinase